MLAKTNLPDNREYVYDSSMTQEAYVDLCCHLKWKAESHMAQFFITLDERTELHRNFKLDTCNEASKAKFEKFVDHIKELQLACATAVYMADRLKYKKTRSYYNY